MQLINSTVIRELSNIIFFPGAYIRGPISGRLISGGLDRRAYNRVLISGGIYPGGI